MEQEKREEGLDVIPKTHQVFSCFFPGCFQAEILHPKLLEHSLSQESKTPYSH